MTLQVLPAADLSVGHYLVIPNTSELGRVTGVASYPDGRLSVTINGSRELVELESDDWVRIETEPEAEDL